MPASPFTIHHSPFTILTRGFLLLCAISVAASSAPLCRAQSLLPAEGGVTDAPDVDHLKTLVSELPTPRWEAAVHELERMGKAAAPAEPPLVDLLGRLSDPADQWDVIKALRTIAGPEQPEANTAYIRIKLNNSMIQAALAGDQPAVEKALHDGADINARFLDFDSTFELGRGGYTALMGAALSGRPDLAKFLLAGGADVNATRQGKTALTIAVMALEGAKRQADGPVVGVGSGQPHTTEADDEAMIKLLVDAGAKGDPKRIRLVHEMIRAACLGFDAKPNDRPIPPGVPGDLKVAEPIATVIAKGGDVNAPDEQGYTPLMYAANLGMVKNVQTLLAAGADPAVALRNGITALSLAQAGAKAQREGCGAVADVLQAAMKKK